MKGRRTDPRSLAEWAVAAEAAAKKLASAPPRSLRAVVEVNLPAIELRLKRGWTIAQLVHELDEAGITTTVPVFKNTLYRLRQKTRRKGIVRQSAADESPTQGPSSLVAPEPTSTPIFKARADAKKHF